MPNFFLVSSVFYVDSKAFAKNCPNILRPYKAPLANKVFSFCILFPICNLILSTPFMSLHSWNLPLYKRGVWFFEIYPKIGGSDFPHKKGGVGKIGWAVLMKVESLHTKWSFPMISFSEWFLYVCVLFFYTISISILCVSAEEISFTESNQQIYGFCKWVNFEKLRHYGTL